jgi:hypothetical protein
MKTGVADLPLHYGNCPRWLFDRMVKLSRAITKIIVLEYGKKEFLRRISDPFFFQSLSCVLGYDWHSSGCTTVTCAALKEALKPEELGMTVLGGKGKASRKTLEEIEKLAETFSLTTKRIEQLKYASKMSAKVDNSAVQDGFQLYHHSFIVTEDGSWAVVQQGMNPSNKYARRYHWLSEKVSCFVVEPHAAVVCDFRGKALNMVAIESEEARKSSVDLVKDNPAHLKKYFSPLFKYLHMQPEHEIELTNYERLMKSFFQAYEQQPKNFEELLAVKGIGPKSVRALALLSKLVFGIEASWRDPATFSFAHGGKDGTPYFVDRKTYDKSIEVLQAAIEQAELGQMEKVEALKRLKDFF